MLVTGHTTMPTLYLLKKPIPQSHREAQPAACGPLQQLASIDRAAERLQLACCSLSSVTDRATKLHAKLQRGTEEFIAAWNAAHPEQMIRRCRGVATAAA